MKEQYKTTNFHIASWLIMNEKKLLSVDWANKRRAEFVFEDFKERETLVNDFFKQELLQKKISADQELKARMYASHSPETYDRQN
jgi:hypothetical protein